MFWLGTGYPCHLLLPHANPLTLSSVHGYRPRSNLSALVAPTCCPTSKPCPEHIEGPVLSLKFTLSQVEGKEIGFVFPYLQKNGSHLALQLDITLETIPLLRHNTTPPLNAISRLTTVFTTHKKRLMSSCNPQPHRRSDKRPATKNPQRPLQRRGVPSPRGSDAPLSTPVSPSTSMSCTIPCLIPSCPHVTLCPWLPAPPLSRAASWAPAAPAPDRLGLPGRCPVCSTTLARRPLPAATAHSR